MVVSCFLWLFGLGSLVLNSRAWKGIAFRKASFLDLAEFLNMG